jgi:hypothetical protein
LLLTIWFLYMFTNYIAKLKWIYLKMENIFLALLDVIVAYVPLIGFAVVYFFQEKSIFLLFTLMIMICCNLFIKFTLQKETKFT